MENVARKKKETVEHVLLKCEAYARERCKLFQALSELEMNVVSMQALLGDCPKQVKVYEGIINFLKDTFLINRI